MTRLSVVPLSACVLLLAGCLSRGPGGPFTAEPVPLVSAERDIIQRRTSELRARLAEGTARGRARAPVQRELDLLERRLAEGDLRVGDQLVISLLGDTGMGVDTATVREGMLVSFAGLPDLEIAQTLRAEVQPRLQAHADRFFRNRTVRVVLPVRVAVLGQVARPGYYSLTADRPVSELIMLAGGPLPTADLGKVVVRRDGKTVVGTTAWDRARQAGMTLGALGLRPDDEIEVGARRQVNWGQISQLALIAAGAAVAFLQVLVLIYGQE
jgi:protein involved in polysaccharide export with SLBB domain